VCIAHPTQRVMAIFHMQWVAMPSKKPFPQSPLKSTTLIGYTIPVWGWLKCRHLPHQDILFWILPVTATGDWPCDWLGVCASSSVMCISVATPFGGDSGLN